MVGVNVHNQGEEIHEHFYKLFEMHFEYFLNRGLLTLPSVEIKIRDNDYKKLSFLINHFSRKFIPITYKNKIHHAPFLVLVHGGTKQANTIAVNNNKLDILCHPGKDEGYFNKQIANNAFKHNIGMEINYREYIKSDDKESHIRKLSKMISIMKKEKNKLFLCSASINKQELPHIKDLIKFGRLLHEDLIDESIENVYGLLSSKYKEFFNNISFDFDKMFKKLRI